MKKIVRDGKVAVLYSPGFGAGWYSWNTEYPDLIFDPDIIAAFEAGDRKNIKLIAEAKYPKVYLGGVYQLAIEWLPEGTLFEISEYDGHESIRVIDISSEFLTA